MASITEYPASIVKVSPKYQLVIPREFREDAGIKPGARFMMIPVGDGFRLVHLRPLSALRGIVPLDESVEIRDKTDRIDRGLAP